MQEDTIKRNKSDEKYACMMFCVKYDFQVLLLKIQYVKKQKQKPKIILAIFNINKSWWKKWNPVCGRKNQWPSVSLKWMKSLKKNS